VSGFTVLAVPHFFHAGQSKTSRAAVDIHGHGTASRRADDHIRLVLVELLLGDPDGLGEILVGQLRVDDGMAVVLEVGRLDATRDRLPAVKEENFHEGIVADLASSVNQPNLRVSGVPNGMFLAIADWWA
jgi:hypothetical protein